MNITIDYIYNLVLPVLKKNNIEDNTENRYYALQRFRSALEESASANDTDMSSWLLLISAELMSLQFKLGAI